MNTLHCSKCLSLVYYLWQWKLVLCCLMRELRVKQWLDCFVILKVLCKVVLTFCYTAGDDLICGLCKHSACMREPLIMCLNPIQISLWTQLGRLICASDFMVQSSKCVGLQWVKTKQSKSAFYCNWNPSAQHFFFSNRAGSLQATCPLMGTHGSADLWVYF